MSAALEAVLGLLRKFDDAVGEVPEIGAGLFSITDADHRTLLSDTTIRAAFKNTPRAPSVVNQIRPRTASRKSTAALRFNPSRIVKGHLVTLNIVAVDITICGSGAGSIDRSRGDKGSGYYHRQTKKRRTQWALTREEMKDCHWLKPILVAQIEFTEWTPDGYLRHAKYVGLRQDKKARDVVR